jgi:hypothetical protein
MREDHGMIFDNSRCCQPPQRLGFGHDEVRKDSFIAADGNDCIAEPDATLQEHLNHHGLRQGDNQDVRGINLAAVGSAAPPWEGIVQERQENGKVIAFREDGELRAPINSADKVRDVVNVSLQIE